MHALEHQRQLIVATVFLLAWLGLPRLGLSLAGPVAVALAAVAAVVCVRRGGEGWAALGLAAPARPLRLLWVGPAYAVIGYLAAIAATLLATQLLGWAPMQSGKVGAVQGNLPALLGMLAIAWTTAALGEELLFRGFLQGRLQALLAGRRGAGLLAALAQGLVFGLAHAYQGATGILVTGVLGLVFGLLYLRSKSLWPLVIAHGLIDTLSLVALYAGKLPAQ
ncbi:CPBP family intramembrane glutamic endopeptidase [Arenimonas caeni]|uniref:CPBP family intramembrane metalloprotease n=2 Tax=Arenimonas caeni TaxID=2058085 RepID=A0A2P6M926_9GAMM|nr:CPBP family intramembrane glutamic endopeptidase [Arenimonas caeni]PRH82483.1 CPBP family intramembrane metalloprotease [Arenimonas caeni]